MRFPLDLTHLRLITWYLQVMLTEIWFAQVDQPQPHLQLLDRLQPRLQRLQRHLVRLAAHQYHLVEHQEVLLTQELPHLHQVHQLQVHPHTKTINS